jgi:hypothetical protein
LVYLFTTPIMRKAPKLDTDFSVFIFFENFPNSVQTLEQMNKKL